MALAQAASKSLQKLPTTLEEDNKMLADTEKFPYMTNERNILLMRRGEKDVLTHYILLKQKCLPLFDMQWKDLKKVVATRYRVDNPVSAYVKAVVVPLVKGQ